MARRRKRKSSRRKQLVVDASILRASGGPEAIHPQATRCRDVLDCIFDEHHLAFLPSKLEIEWKDNSSNAAQVWFRRMHLGRRLRREPPPPIYPPLGDLPATPPLSRSEQQAINKDAHLVEAAAMTADGVVLSLDDAMRALLLRLSHPRPEEMRNLAWINPTADDQHKRVVDWLAGYGVPHPSWRLVP